MPEQEVDHPAGMDLTGLPTVIAIWESVEKLFSLR